MSPTRTLTLAFATAAALLLAAAPAGAATYVVTKRGDPALDGCKKRDCSLREAVRRAGAHAGRDVIELPNRRKPYVLRQTSDDPGAIDIVNDPSSDHDPLVIKHPGKGRATVDANGIDRVFNVFSNAPTTFRKLVITGGHSVGKGAGIGSGGANLRVVRSRIAGNESTISDGGGIALTGGASLELVDSTVAANFAEDGGGGISDGAGSITIVRSRIVRNETGDVGGGLLLDSVSTGADRGQHDRGK